MLKMKRKLSELLKDFSSADTVSNHEFLLGDDADLKHNILTFYSVAGSQISRKKITSMMSKAGYTLIDSLSKVNKNVDELDGLSIQYNLEQQVDYKLGSETLFMNEEDFMDLLPANNYFH